MILRYGNKSRPAGRLLLIFFLISAMFGVINEAVLCWV